MVYCVEAENHEYLHTDALCDLSFGAEIVASYCHC